MANLITINTYKQAKAITSSKDDERLDLIVSSVSQLVKTYCNNSFVDYATSAKTEYFTQEWAYDTIQLSESPIITVEEVWERTAIASDYIQLVEDTSFAINTKTDSIIRVDSTWATGLNSIKVVYTAGYTTTPADLTLALVDLVSYYYKEEHKNNKQLSSASISNPSGSLRGNIGFPDHIKRVLDMYRLT